MKIPKEVQCQTCRQVFCCAKCRQKHEDNTHLELKAIRQICYICNNRPFPLRIDTKITPSNVLVDHIIKQHLPLRCNRCAKVFHTAADFKSIARCHPICSSGVEASDTSCHLEHSPNIPTILETAAEVSIDSEDKENVAVKNCSSGSSNRSNAHSTSSNGHAPLTAIKIKAPPAALAVGTPSISKELHAITDPIEEIEELNEAMLTPLSMINLRWKRKSRQSFDSMMSGSNNISAVNGSELVPNSPSKKLVRTTSTPMMRGGHVQGSSKCPNESSGSTLGQMSSIHSNSSSSDSDSRSNDCTPGSPSTYEIQKVRAIIRSRSKVAATPLRQVMSKSIQRAIAQHGGYSKMLAPGTQRKMSFNTTASFGMNSSGGGGTPSRRPLDLRTTPVLKRSSSESTFGSQEGAKMIRKTQSEDLAVTFNLEEASKASSEYYDTHQNLESFETTGNVDQENRDNHRIAEQSLLAGDVGQFKALPICYQETPKMAGGMLKKVISFTTPEITRIGLHPADKLDPNESIEVWATPCSIPPRSFSCSALQDTRFDDFPKEDSHNSDGSISDDVFLPPPAKTKPYKQSFKPHQPPIIPSTGKLWTIVSNVIRLASRSDIQDELTTGDSLPEYSSGSESGGANGPGSSSTASSFPSTFVRRAASFAGFLKNRLPGGRQSGPTSSSDSDAPEAAVNRSATKRRRTNSVYTRPYETAGSAIAHMRPISSPLAKRKRIQGRQPIERMRAMPGEGD